MPSGTNPNHLAWLNHHQAPLGSKLQRGPPSRSPGAPTGSPNRGEPEWPFRFDSLTSLVLARMVSLPASTLRHKVVGERDASAFSARAPPRPHQRIGGLHEPLYRSRAFGSLSPRHRDFRPGPESNPAAIRVHLRLYRHGKARSGPRIRGLHQEGRGGGRADRRGATLDDLDAHD